MTDTSRFRSDAIAIVGVSCRLPGAASPDAFWQLLENGRDAITEPQAGRWETDSPTDSTTAFRGGFLEGVAGFDAAFFGVSPREAAAMDPQQRLVLELAWEAIEDAGLPAERLKSASTGVFVGAIAGDYALLADRQGAAAITPHTMSGQNRGIIANRVSYTLGLRAPPDRAAPVTEAELSAAIRRVTGKDIGFGNPVWLSRFDDTTRLAGRYRAGRVLLAGDAAHVHFPLSGQGMIVGVQDAVNLGWKLAAAVRGWAPPDLLDSYEAERRPVGERVCRDSRAQSALMFPPHWTAPLKGFVGELLGVDAAHRMLVERVAGVDVRYDTPGRRTGIPWWAVGSRTPR